MKTVITMIFCAVVLTAGFVQAQDVNTTVQAGKSIKFDYTLTVDKEEIETSTGKEPLMAIIGSNQIIPGLEKQLIGMKIGEEKIINVDAKEAYGEVDAKAILDFPLSSLPQDQKPEVGMTLQAQAPDGSSFPAVIKEIKGDQVKIDFNHPLAGKTLQFKIKIISIENAPVAPVAPAATPATK